MNDHGKTNGALLIACGLTIMCASMLGPAVGKCGTAHSLLAAALGTALAVAVHAVWAFKNVDAVTSACFMLVNVCVFLVPAILLYKKVNEVRYATGLLLWTGAYLVSYFFLFAITNCP